MTWDENKPRLKDLILDIGPVLHSHKTEFRAGIEKHFFWDESSGASAGEPRLSDGSLGPGSARAFYGAASEVSANRDGGMMVTSDTSRLYGLTSLSSAGIGGSLAVIDYSAATIPTNKRNLVQSGTVAEDTGSYTTAFPTAYDGVPALRIQATKAMSSNTDFDGWSAVTGDTPPETGITLEASGDTAHSTLEGATGLPSTFTVHWTIDTSACEVDEIATVQYAFADDGDEGGSWADIGQLYQYDLSDAGSNQSFSITTDQFAAGQLLQVTLDYAGIGSGGNADLAMPGEADDPPGVEILLPLPANIPFVGVSALTQGGFTLDIESSSTVDILWRSSGTVDLA